MIACLRAGFFPLAAMLIKTKATPPVCGLSLWRKLICGLPGHSWLASQSMCKNGCLAGTNGWQDVCMCHSVRMHRGWKWTSKENEKQQWERVIKSHFHQYWIRYDCAPWSLPHGNLWGTWLETGHCLVHIHTEIQSYTNTQRLYHPQAEHCELRGYTSMLIGWGLWRIY